MQYLSIFLFLSSILFANPEWLLNPPFGAVGNAKPCANEQKQERIAILNAKAELSRQAKIHIESQSTNINQKFETISLQTANNFVKKTAIKERFRDADNILYVWIYEE